jgi:hypothetical protein
MSDYADGSETAGGYDGDPEPRSEGGGLRANLEKLARENAELKTKLTQEVTEAEQRGAMRAQRRFDALQFFGPDKPGLAEAWVDKHPEGDLTPEGAKDFAAAYGVSLEPQAPPEPQVSPEVQQAAQAFQQPLAAAPGSLTLDSEEFRRMLRDPTTRDEAMRAEREGRVKRKVPIDPRLVSINDGAGFFAQPPA